MDVGGGEATDQLVRMMLSGTEMSVRLGGSAKKRFSVGTRLARYQHQLLYTQRFRTDEEDG